MSTAELAVKEMNMDGEQKRILLEEIKVTYNPRKRFDPEALAELLESIKTKGLAQPLLVRPITPVLDPSDKQMKNFELVAGGRRFKCFQTLGRDEVPCFVRDLSDQDVLELQLIENLQRADLDLMEEAEGYEKLLQTAGYTAANLAAKVGKTPRYIYQRLKLLFLPEAARVALLAGKIGFGHARQIACLPHEDWRTEATRIVLDPKRCKIPAVANIYWNHPQDEALTAAQTTELLTTRYMKELKTAPFEQKDAALVPLAGPCTTCPKRAGNSPELFPHLRADMCTDVKCYGAKLDAAREIVVTEAKNKGQRVLSKEESLKVLTGTGGTAGVAYGAPYVDPDEQPSYDVLSSSFAGKSPKWSALVKGREVPTVLAVDANGGVHRLIDRKLALEAAKANRPELFLKRDTSPGSAAGKKEAERRAKEAEVQHEIFADLIDGIQLKLEKGSVEKNVGNVFATALLQYAFVVLEDRYNDALEIVCKRRRLTVKNDDWEAALIALVKAMGDCAEQKLALAIELLLTNDEEEDLDDRGVKIFAGAYKLDRDKIEKQVKAAVATRKPWETPIGMAICKAIRDAGAPGARALGIFKVTSYSEKEVQTWLKAHAKDVPGLSELGAGTFTFFTKPVDPKAAKKAAVANAELGEQILEKLKKAGAAGTTPKEMSFAIGVRVGNVTAWLNEFGKKNKSIVKIDEATYAFKAVEKAVKK